MEEGAGDLDYANYSFVHGVDVDLAYRHSGSLQMPFITQKKGCAADYVKAGKTIANLDSLIDFNLDKHFKQYLKVSEIECIANSEVLSQECLNHWSFYR